MQKEQQAKVVSNLTI